MNVFTIECPLPNGAVASRTYWLDEPRGVAWSSLQLPWHKDDPFEAFAAIGPILRDNNIETGMR